MSDAPGLMAGKKGLVLGVANERSIAWGIAETLNAHGAEMAFTYQNKAFAKRVTPLAEGIGSDLVLPCDVDLGPQGRQRTHRDDSDDSDDDHGDSLLLRDIPLATGRDRHARPD